jgi:hypothetical protein
VAGDWWLPQNPRTEGNWSTDIRSQAWYSDNQRCRGWLAFEPAGGVIPPEPAVIAMKTRVRTEWLLPNAF